MTHDSAFPPPTNRDLPLDALERARALLPNDGALAGRSARAASRASAVLGDRSVAQSRLRRIGGARLAVAAAIVLAVAGAVALLAIRGRSDSHDGAPRTVNADDSVPDSATDDHQPRQVDRTLRDGAEPLDDAVRARIEPAIALVSHVALAEYRFDDAALVAVRDVPPDGALPDAPVVFVGDIPADITVAAGCVAIFVEPLRGFTITLEAGASAYFLDEVRGQLRSEARCLVSFARGFRGGLELGPDARVWTTDIGGSVRLGPGSRLVCDGDVSGPIAVPEQGSVTIMGDFASQATVGAGGTLVIAGEGRGGLTLGSGARAFAGSWRGSVGGAEDATLILPMPAPWLSGNPRVAVDKAAFDRALERATVFDAGD